MYSSLSLFYERIGDWGEAYLISRNGDFGFLLDNIPFTLKPYVFVEDYKEKKHNKKEFSIWLSYC